MKKPFLHAKHQQKGAVLLVALVMLLLLTLIGVASMRGTSLQENMANNLKERQLAFQAAEAALRAGERRAERERIWLREQDEDEDEDEGEEIHCLLDGDVDGFSLGKNPEYEICLKYKKPPLNLDNPEKVDVLMVSINATGYGLAVDSNNKPVVSVELRSTYRIEFD